MNKLKSGKADGIDGITADILKADTDKATHYLKKKYSQVFGIKTPCHLFWTKALLVKTQKRGDRSICNNYRGITFLFVPSKVFSRILRGSGEAAM